MTDRGQRPFGRIRGDFDRALLTGNAAGAQKLLEEMRASGRVSAEQRKCLEIRYLAGLGRYEELARNQALIVSVMDLPLPPQTLVDVVGSLYATYIAPVEPTADLDLIRKTFKQYIARPYGPLFREWKGIRQPEILRAFLLYESVLDQPNLDRCKTLMGAYREVASGKDLAERIVANLHPPKVADAQETRAHAMQAIADEDYPLATQLCFRALPDPWAYKALLRCAVEMRDGQLTVRVLDAISQADDSIRAGFAKRDLQRLEQLTATPPKIQALRHDTSWNDWARWVLSEPEGNAQLVVMEAAVVAWDIGDYAHDADRCRELAQLIGNASGAAERTFREAFPQLVEFFVDRPNKPVRAFAPINSILIKIIAWGGVTSADELHLCFSITEALLATGPEKELYVESLDDLLEILRASNAPNNIDWALNVSELLVLYPTQAADLRLRVFMAAVNLVRAWAHRITSAQRSILELLAKDYECPDLMETLPSPELDETAGEVDLKFSGLIGIYTLSESSGLRAKDVLKNMLSLARIETNGDVVATDRLRNLARSADVFVFAWKKSSHQAYYCAKDARGERELLMPQGGGTASLVRAVIECVRT